jgi:hypothetical protein
LNDFWSDLWFPFFDKFIKIFFQIKSSNCFMDWIVIWLILHNRKIFTCLAFPDALVVIIMFDVTTILSETKIPGKNQYQTVRSIKIFFNHLHELPCLWFYSCIKILNKLALVITIPASEKPIHLFSLSGRISILISFCFQTLLHFQMIHI